MTAEFEQPLREILTVTTRAIPGETLTSVALLGDGGPYTVAFSEPGAVALDTLQFSIGAGPCLDAIKSGEAVWSDDLVSEPRWTGPAASSPPTACEARTRSRWPSTATSRARSTSTRSGPAASPPRPGRPSP
ncbi:GAF domain-containing protein [Nonomuraea ferruginea]